MQPYATRIKASYGGYRPAPPPKDTIKDVEIASLLGMKLATFRRRRAQLISLGMPRPVPGVALVWSRPNVLAWIHGAGAAHALPGTARDPVELAREALEQRMAGRDA